MLETVSISNCAANGISEMELGTDSRGGKCLGQIVKYWYRIICLDIDVVKQCYGWQKSNMSGRSWTAVLVEELCNSGLAFVRRKQQDCNVGEITKVKDR